MRQIEAHLAATRGTSTRVCVVDSPIAASHRDFVGKVVASAHFPGNASWGQTADYKSHGSHVASAISTNGIGLASVAPGAVLLSANVFGKFDVTSVAQVIDGMMWCVQPAQRADVINMSLGALRTKGSDAWKSDSAIYWVYTTVARTKGAVVVASAGNDGVALPNASKGYLPAQTPGVISVGATGPASNTSVPFVPQAPHPSFDQRAAYSNHNSGNDALGVGVHIYAPGGTKADLSQLRILGVCHSLATLVNCSGADTYFAAYGTSMAAPHVAGVVALITQRYAARARNLSRVMDIEACLLQTADALPAGSPFFGRGRVNARRATTEACPGL
jgi:subtilisin family serine protease